MEEGITKEVEEEYDQLSRFIDFYYTNIMKFDLSNPAHPRNILKNIEESVGKVNALVGLKHAVNDAVEMALEWDGQKDAEVNQMLGSNAIFTLNFLRVNYWRKYKMILDRGKILNEREHEVLDAIVNDDNLAMEAREKEQISKLIAEFKNK